MNVYEKLQKVQEELKAPKSQYNSFGKYNYRNLEDILEALKPHMATHKLALTITDDIDLIGDRYYVVATATLIDIEDSNQKIEVQARAREELSKKGMDASQITGSTSSYARKYALNGLFCIDDTKDSDSQDNRNTGQQNGNKTTNTNVQNNNTSYKCLDCGTGINQGVHAFSTNKYGRALCMNCQKKQN